MVSVARFSDSLVLTLILQKCSRSISCAHVWTVLTLKIREISSRVLVFFFNLFSLLAMLVKSVRFRTNFDESVLEIHEISNFENRVEPLGFKKWSLHVSGKIHAL